MVSLFASLTVMSESASAATECSNASIVNKSYTLIGPSGVRTVPDMTGQVRQGDTVMLQFTVAPFFISECTVSLVSYTAPNGNFNTANLYRQRVYQSSSGPVTGGDWEVTVKVPTCYFQADFVRGAPITQFGPTSANTYHGQGRFLDGAVGGTEACGVDDAPLPPGAPPQMILPT